MKLYEIRTSGSGGNVTVILNRLGQGHSDPKMVCDASTHQILNSFLKEYKGFALDTIILKSRSEVNVSDPQMICYTPPTKDEYTHQIWNSYATLCHPKNSEYDQEIPQSQTADNPVAPRGRAAQPSRDTRKTN